MKLAKWLIMLSLLMIPFNSAVVSSNQESSVVIVNCPDPEGCFRVIERAVQAAPPGTTLRVLSGIYYEKPFTIDKSISIIGVGKPLIQLVDPFSGLFIGHLPNHDPMQVTIQGVRILSPVSLDELYYSPKQSLTNGRVLAISNESLSPEDLTVDIEDVSIYGYRGIAVGAATVSLRESSIEAQLSSVEARQSVIVLQKNFLFVQNLDYLAGPTINVSLKKNTTASLVENTILTHGHPLLEDQDFNVGVYVGSLVREDATQTTFEGNTITAYIGIFLPGKAQTEMNHNQFINNRRYGILIFHPSCTYEFSEPAIYFEGELKGIDNEFKDNAQDVCPADFPLPPGFAKPSTKPNG